VKPFRLWWITCTRGLCRGGGGESGLVLWPALARQLFNGSRVRYHLSVQLSLSLCACVCPHESSASSGCAAGTRRGRVVAGDVCHSRMEI
jgi:hypothetical protein